MRLVFFKVILAITCFGASSRAFYLALHLPLPDRKDHVLALLALGTLLGLVAGFFFGRPLWECVRRGRKWWTVVVVTGVLSGLAFYGFLTAFAGHMPYKHPLAEPLIMSAAVLLLSANSRALGNVFVSGCVRVPGYRRIAAVILLYGSLLGGFAFHRISPLPWGTISPERLSRDGRPFFVRPEPWVREAFPPECVVEEGEGGEVCYQCAAGRRLKVKAISGDDSVYPEKPSVREFQILPAAVDISTSFGDDVVVADGSRVRWDDGEIEVVRLTLYTNDKFFARRSRRQGTSTWEEEEFAPQRAIPVGSWRLDGTPVKGGPVRDVRFSWGIRTVAGIFSIRTEGEVWLDESEDHELLFMPWERAVGFEIRHEMISISGDGPPGTVPVAFNIGRPVRGPLELRLVVLRGDEVEHHAPNEAGAIIQLDRNRLQLLSVLPGRYLGECPASSNRLTLIPLLESPDAGKTTAVFLTHFWEPTPARLCFQAVRNDGRLFDPSNIGRREHYIRVEFPIPREEIAQYRIVERTRFTQVRFPLKEIPLFPRANEALTDLLAMRVPYHVGHCYDLLPLTGYPWHYYFIERSPIRHRNPTVRELLDHHYPASWRLEEGRVEFEVREGLRARLFELARGRKPYLDNGTTHGCDIVRVGP